MPRTPYILGGVFVIFVILAWWVNSSSLEADKNKLPFINPNDVNHDLVDDDQQEIGNGHTIRYFELTNQDGKLFTGKELDGKVYVADFFFTTCGGICPKMTKQMKRIQDAFENDDRVRLVSHTVTPEHDTAEVLKKYAERHGADFNKWTFLTGDKREIYGLARRAYFVVKKAAPGEDDGSGNDFIHTQNFVLVDAKKRIRGYYNGTSSTSVDSLINDIKVLLDE